MGAWGWGGEEEEGGGEYGAGGASETAEYSIVFNVM